MPRKHRKPRHKHKRRRAGPSEGLGRKSSTAITRLVEVPPGLSGSVFSVEQLLRNYFKDPRRVKISNFTIKLSPLDSQQPYYQFQVYTSLDRPDTPFVCLTGVRKGTTLPIRSSITIDQPRRYWVESTDETKFLDIHFQVFTATKIVVEITTYFNIEMDELSVVEAMQAISLKAEQPIASSDNFEYVTIKVPRN